MGRDDPGTQEDRLSRPDRHGTVRPERRHYRTRKIRLSRTDAGRGSRRRSRQSAPIPTEFAIGYMLILLSFRCPIYLSIQLLNCRIRAVNVQTMAGPPAHLCLHTQPVVSADLKAL